MFKNVVILAGGDGTRMQPLTHYIPKGLVKVNGQALINGLIENFKKHSIENIYVTYGHLSSVLFNELKTDVLGFINTTGRDNSYFLFNSLIKYINEPIVVIPCDLEVEIDFDKLYKNYFSLNQPPIMLVGTLPIEGVDGDYILYNENNNIITELSRNNTESKIYCSGIQIINPYKVNIICEPHENFYRVWGELIKKEELKVSDLTPTKWNAYDKINQII